MEFLKSSELSLNPANYLIGTSNKPVTHPQWVVEQQKADYVVRLAKAMEGKTFKASKLDDINAIKAEVRAAMTGTSTSYIPVPAKPTSKVNDEIVQYALDFAKYEDNKIEAENINNIMQGFNTINAVESVGDYFSEGVVKVSNIYSIKEILAAVQAIVPVLGNIN